MEANLLAQQALSVVEDNSALWSTIIGALGGIIGTMLTLTGNAWLARRNDRKASLVTEKRKDMLREMLTKKGNKAGRSLQTLMTVTGAPEEECCRLLVEIGARGLTLPDGREGWTFVVDRPFQNQSLP